MVVDAIPPLAWKVGGFLVAAWVAGVFLRVERRIIQAIPNKVFYGAIVLFLLFVFGVIPI